MTATILPLPGPGARMPPELRAVLALLRRIADPQLRRYCQEQIGAAGTEEEIAAALALLRALAAPPPGQARTSAPAVAVAGDGAARSA